MSMNQVLQVSILPFRWLVDAILEYTALARLPGVFLQEGQVAATMPIFNTNAKDAATMEVSRHF